MQAHKSRQALRQSLRVVSAGWSFFGFSKSVPDFRGSYTTHLTVRKTNYIPLKLAAFEFLKRKRITKRVEMAIVIKQQLSVITGNGS